mgnify:CR=1 FL=1
MAEYSIRKEKILSSDSSSKNKGYNNRIFGTNLEAQRLIEEGKDHPVKTEKLFEKDIEYSFSGSVRTVNELETDFQNEIRLFGIDFKSGNRAYKINPHNSFTAPDEIGNPVSRQTLDGYLSLEVSKYLKIITIDEIQEFVDNSSTTLDAIHSELEKVFIYLSKWVAVKYDMPNLIEDFKELLNSPKLSQDDNYYLELEILALSAYILGFKIEENPAGVKEKVVYKFSKLGVFDSVNLLKQLHLV